MGKKITASRLRELLIYDADTGIFTRRITNGSAVVGTLAGSNNGFGYIRISLDGIRYQAHRLAWLYMTGDWPSKLIDHINGSRFDNRFINLRDVSATWNQQNQRRAHKCNKTGFLGVFVDRGRFRSAIQYQGKNIYLGYFDSAEQAHSAYMAAKLKMHLGAIHG